jgi:transposase-like protein
LKTSYQVAQQFRSSIEALLPELSIMGSCREVFEEAFQEMIKVVVSGVLQASAEALTGPKRQGKRKVESSLVRHGSQAGSIYIGRSKFRVDRPRVRSKDGKEAKIPAYERLNSDDEACRKISDSVLAGVSTRKYKKAVEASFEAVGSSKSTISRRFIGHSTKQLEAFMERPVPKHLVALMLDGIRLGRSLVVVGIGIDSEGKKHALSVAEGSTENSATVKSLLENLIERGLDVDRKLLFVVDGGKALLSSIQTLCGSHHPIQRCRVHKMRNVLEKLPTSKKRYVRAALSAAWKLPAKSGLQRMQDTARELQVSHREASRSLLEGLEETFTVNKLELPPLLIRSLGSTNIIENAQGSIRNATKQVSEFHKPEDAKRWAANILMNAQEHFQILPGYKDLWMLQATLGHSTENDVLDPSAKAG